MVNESNVPDWGGVSSGFTSGPAENTRSGFEGTFTVGNEQFRVYAYRQLSQVPKAHPPPPPGVTDSPYPYYTPREGEVVWPPGSIDPSQNP